MLTTLLLIAATAGGFVTKARPSQDLCTVRPPDVPENGLPPADVGDRQPFDPDDYLGADVTRFTLAFNDALPVGGAIVMHRFFEWCGQSVSLNGLGGGGLMITGGGIRRCCSPNQTVTVDVVGTDTCVTVADTTDYVVGRTVSVFVNANYAASYDTFTIASKTATTLCKGSALGFTANIGEVVGYSDSGMLTLTTNAPGLVIDSVAFDGQADCNGQNHGWTVNPVGALRAGVSYGTVIQNSYVYDTPSEGFTTCGVVLHNNTVWNLGGSLAHGSCSVDGIMNTLTNNRAYNVNIFGDAVMQHSEGLITFSAEAGGWDASGNVFQLGYEGVWGLGSTEDNDIDVQGDCYADFPRIIQVYDDGSGVDKSGWRFNVMLERTGPGICCSATVGQGSPL